MVSQYPATAAEISVYYWGPGGAPRFWVRYHNITWRNLGSQRWRGAKVWMLT